MEYALKLFLSKNKQTVFYAWHKVYYHLRKKKSYIHVNSSIISLGICTNKNNTRLGIAIVS